MKITINTEVLQKEGLSLNDFLVLLIGYYDVNYRETLDNLKDKGVIQPSLFNKMSMVLSNNTRDYVASILVKCDEKVMECGIDFMHLARKLQAIYPQGNKPGTSYSWTGDTETIALKLRILVSKYDFAFTEGMAINATKEYVSLFGEDKKKMLLLKNFLLRTNTGNHEMESMFMTILENNNR